MYMYSMYCILSFIVFCCFFQRGFFQHGDHAYDIEEVLDDIDETGAQTVNLKKTPRRLVLNDCQAEHDRTSFPEFAESGISFISFFFLEKHMWCIFIASM